MDSNSNIALQNPLNLREVLTTGSILNINEDYNETETELTSDNTATRNIHFIGGPVSSFEKIAKEMVKIDSDGYVRKRIIEEGGGVTPNENCTLSFVYSGFWENEPEPFDVRELYKPLVVNINDNGLLLGLQIALKSMLVGELSVFLLSYQVMYGEMGIPPRIKPKSDCVFYIRLVKSIITPKEGEINFSEPNMFARVCHEVNMLISSGVQMHKSNNIIMAIQLFKKGICLLDKCRLADEKEEQKQEKLRIKLYTNLAICYNKMKQPFKTCIVCNELNRLNSLWNNAKTLFQNAKALRMIGEFDRAKKKLIRAKHLCPDEKEIEAEFELLEKTRNLYDRNKLLVQKLGLSVDSVTDAFKNEVEDLIKKFKEDASLCVLPLPMSLTTSEIKYIKSVCIRENIFCNGLEKNHALNKTEEQTGNELKDDELKENL